MIFNIQEYLIDFLTKSLADSFEKCCPWLLVAYFIGTSLIKSLYPLIWNIIGYVLVVSSVHFYIKSLQPTIRFGALDTVIIDKINIIKDREIDNRTEELTDDEDDDVYYIVERPILSQPMMQSKDGNDDVYCIVERPILSQPMMQSKDGNDDVENVDNHNSNHDQNDDNEDDDQWYIVEIYDEGDKPDEDFLLNLKANL